MIKSGKEDSFDKDVERRYCALVEYLIDQSKDGQSIFTIGNKEAGGSVEDILPYLLHSTIIQINHIEKEKSGDFYLPSVENIDIEFVPEQLKEEFEHIFLKQNEENNEIEDILESYKPIYEIIFEDYQRIVLHKLVGNEPDVVISAPHFRSENQKFFQYMYEHPNKIIEAQEIKENALRSVLKNKGAVVPCKEFKSIISNLKFENDLKKAFFPFVSQEAVFFRNPVYLRDLESSGIKGKIDTGYLKI